MNSFRTIALAAAFCLIVVATGCTRAVRVDVEGTPATEAPAAESLGKRFAIRPEAIEPGNRQALKTRLDLNIEAYLIVQGDKASKPPYTLTGGAEPTAAVAQVTTAVRRALERRGYTYDEQSPDVVVAVAVETGHLQYEVAPTVHRAETFGAARPVRPSAGPNTNWPTETHPPYQAGYTAQGGHSAATDATAIGVQFTTPTGTPIWSGAAVAVGSFAQVERVSDVLVDELLSEYPQPSGKPHLRLAPIPE